MDHYATCNTIQNGTWNITTSMVSFKLRVLGGIAKVMCVVDKAKVGFASADY